MNRAWIAFGSNLGDRSVSFRAALEELRKDPRIVFCRGSRIYETEPVGPGDQEPYWNAVLELETSCQPLSLLNACLRIEDLLGRKRAERWGPRVIDLDLLLYEGVRLSQEDIELPHPRLTTRSFVLLPLADLIPEMMVAGKSVCDWLERCEPFEKKIVRESLWPWR